METLTRITQQPGVMGGKPCIRATRVTVGTIVAQIGAGRGIDELLVDYPYLEREDITQAIHYADSEQKTRRADWARNKSQVARRLSQGECGASYGEANHFVCGCECPCPRRLWKRKRSGSKTLCSGFGNPRTKLSRKLDKRTASAFVAESTQ
jgi:uncharacterized protein (DUF433 family)